MSLVSLLSRLARARRSAKSHGQEPLWKWAKNALRLEPLESRSLPSTAVFTTTFSHATTFTGQPLAPLIPQFDTMGGTRTLESVEIISQIELDASVSGTVTNHSGTAATEEATVTNASISVTGTGFTSPLAAAQATLLDTGPVNCAGRTTTTIGPFSASLTNSSDVTLTGGALAPFEGTGNLSYTTSSSADSSDQVTGGSNFIKNTTVSASGTATVEIVYTFVTNPVLETMASQAFTLGALSPTLSDSATLSGASNPNGTITFTLTGPGGFSFTHTDTVHGNGTYSVADALPTTGLVAGTYTWSAHYSGDANNNSANDQGGTAEQSVVNIESDVGGPRLTINKIGGESVLSGDTVDFTIVVSNQGTATAQNVLLTDPLPDVTHLTWTTDAGTITNGVLTDNIGSLSSGATVTIHVSAVTPAGYSATLNNTATATSTNNTPASISASATDIVSAPVVTPGPSSISGSVFLDPGQHGDFVPPDVGLPGLTITLTGLTSSGTPVTTSVVTDSNGNFTFTGLEPGTYNLVETQPVNFMPGANFAGNLGGTPDVDVISAITVSASQTGVNYRFTQLGMAAQAISKQQLLASSAGIQQLMGPTGTGNSARTTDHGPRIASPLPPGEGPGVRGNFIRPTGPRTDDPPIAALLADFLAGNHTEAGAAGGTSQVQVHDASTTTELDSFFATPSQGTGVYVGGISRPPLQSQ